MSAAVPLGTADPAAAIRKHATDGVDRIIEVSLSDNNDLDAAVVKNQAVIAAYATRAERPTLPFWPMLFDNVTIRLLGSDDFPAEARGRAVADLTRAAAAGALRVQVATPLPLAHIAAGHDRVDAGTRARVLIDLTR